MFTERPPLVISALIAGANVLAIADLPYGYYQFLRIVVTAYALWMAFVLGSKDSSVWPWIFGLMAILYNPVFKVAMSRETHGIINLIAAACIIAELFFHKANRQKENQTV